MALIKEKDRATLAQLGEKLTGDVDITLYTQLTSALAVPGVIPCETCEVSEELLQELGGILPKLQVNIVDLVSDRAQAERDGVNRVPTMVLGGAAQRRVRFMGFPGGYEFATFMSALLEAGGSGEDVPAAVRAQLDALSNPVDIKVFVTPS
jgi:alkyl hydroperoxide reductase subunit AhpF